MVSMVHVHIPGADKKTLCMDVKSDTNSQSFMLIRQQRRKSEGQDNPLVGLQFSSVQLLKNRRVCVFVYINFLALHVL